jgi:hypothetical protein
MYLCLMKKKGVTDLLPEVAINIPHCYLVFIDNTETFKLLSSGL